MKTPAKILTLCLAVLAGAVRLSSVRAEAPKGASSISVPADLTLIDPSGDYSESLSDLSLDLTLACDLAGKITGTGLAHGREMGITVRVPLTCTGSISGNNKTPRLSLVIKGSGTASGGGMTFPVTVEANFSGAFDPPSGDFIGSAKAKACVTVERKKECGSMNERSYFEPQDGGPARLIPVLTLATDSKNRITGTGTVSLSNGRQFSTGFKVTGTYTPKRDETKLKLAATDRSGAKVEVTGKATGGVIEPAKSKLSGKVLGQSFKR
jgi:hypothetical protein